MIYFTFSELLRSDTAIKNRIWNGANRTQEDNLVALVENVLDPAREKYGKPVHVSSGFRNAKVNSSMKNASKTSQHMNGEAADLYTDAGAKGNHELGRIIASIGKFDQLIFEDVGQNDLLPQWIHVSWSRAGRNRGEIKKHVKGTGNVYPLVDKKTLGL